MVWLSPTVLILLAGSRWPQVRVAPARSIPLARPAPCALFLNSLRAVFPLRLPLRLLPRHWWALSEWRLQLVSGEGYAVPRRPGRSQPVPCHVVHPLCASRCRELISCPVCCHLHSCHGEPWAGFLADLGVSQWALESPVTTRVTPVAAGVVPIHAKSSDDGYRLRQPSPGSVNRAGRSRRRWWLRLACPGLLAPPPPWPPPPLVGVRHGQPPRPHHLRCPLSSLPPAGPAGVRRPRLPCRPPRAPPALQRHTPPRRSPTTQSCPPAPSPGCAPERTVT